MKKQTIAISEFKARALGVIDRVAKSGESVVITKRGKPVARVVPFGPASVRLQAGTLADTVLEEGDIVSPLGAELWSAAR